MCHYSRFASTSRTVLDFKKIFKLVVNPFIKIESVPLSSLFTEPSNRTSWKWDCGWPQSSFVNFVCSLNMPIKCFSGIVVFSYFLALFGRKQADKKTQILPLNFLFSFSIKFFYDWTIDSFIPSNPSISLLSTFKWYVSFVRQFSITHLSISLYNKSLL